MAKDLLDAGRWIALLTCCLGGCSASAPTDRQATGAAALESSTTITGIGGKCVDANQWSTANGDKIQLWGCDGLPNQSWSLEGDAIAGWGGRCLDVQGNVNANGTRVQLYACNGTTAQQWHLDGGQVVNAGGRCLDAEGGASADGTQLIIWDCWGGPNQQWTFGLGGGASGTGNRDAGSGAVDAGSAGGASAKVPAGLQNLALVWSDIPTIDARLDQLASDVPGIPWLRQDIQDDSAQLAANYVEILRKGHAHGMNVLAMLSITAGDVGGGTFPYALSRVNPAAFAARLQTYIHAFQAAGVAPDAWEIGNELDQSGFNADDTTNESLWVQSYGAFLSTALDTIKAPASFPGATVVTCGMANELTYAVGYHLPDPAATLAALHDFAGQDLLARVDGYGAHVYPAPDSLESWTGSVLQQYVAAGLTDKPIFVTEWGFHRAAFAAGGTTRAQADQQWLTYVNGYPGITLGAAILYDYHQETDMGAAQDYDLFDGDTLRKDEAAVLRDWNR